MTHKWLYGNAWEDYPIEAGQVWGLPNGSRLMVHNIFDPLPAWFQPDLLFVDPPWNQGNVNSFYTKAGRTDYISDFASFEAALFARIDDIRPPVCYLEVGKQAVDRWQAALQTRYACIQRFDVTYYKRNPCHILRGGSDLTRHNYNGMDEADVIAAVAHDEDYSVMGDFCMGRGLVGMAAYSAGKPFVGTELNKRRLAVLLQRLAKVGADIQEIRGEQPMVEDAVPAVNRRGGFRPGAGRPVTRLAMKIGDSFFVTTRTAEGNPVFPSEAWDVVAVTRSEITFQSSSGDTIKMRR